jgi:hypothetical protein
MRRRSWKKRGVEIDMIFAPENAEPQKSQWLFLHRGEMDEDLILSLSRFQSPSPSLVLGQGRALSLDRMIVWRLAGLIDGNAIGKTEDAAKARIYAIGISRSARKSAAVNCPQNAMKERLVLIHLTAAGNPASTENANVLLRRKSA